MASDSSHSMLSPAIWLVCITPILPHARVASLRTDVTAGPGSSGLIPDQTRHLGVPQPQRSRSMGWHRQCPEITKPGSASSSQGAGHPSCLEICGAGTLPCTPVPQYPVRPDPCSARSRAEPILMGAQEGRGVLELRHIARTCHCNCGTGRRCCW